MHKREHHAEDMVVRTEWENRSTKMLAYKVEGVASLEGFEFSATFWREVASVQTVELKLKNSENQFIKSMLQLNI